MSEMTRADLIRLGLLTAHPAPYAAPPMTISKCVHITVTSDGKWKEGGVRVTTP